MCAPRRIQSKCSGQVILAFVGGVIAALALPLALRSQEADSEEQILAPFPKTVPAPKDNPATPEKVALGQQLFFDRRLSGDNSMSCTTCHLPEKAFGDGLDRARGHKGKKLDRNSPSLLNVGFAKNLLWDGRAKTLEDQALVPIESPDEMNQNLDDVVRELEAVAGYRDQFKRVFGTGVTRAGIAQALAAFQRTLVTGPSPFDLYLAGDESALSDAAKRGLELFRSDAGCIRCHHGPLLSDGDFYRLGVSFKDKGRAGVTGKGEDEGKFRTPSLRNIAQTAPYMHDGSLATLEEVVTFYYRGVPSTSDGKPLDIERLSGRSFSEIADLVAFLESLTGEAPKITPPALP